MCRFFVLFFGWVFTEEKLFLFLFLTNELSLAFFLISIVDWFVSIYFFLSIFASHCTTKGRIQIKICIDTRLENKDRQNGERDNEGGY